MDKDNANKSKVNGGEFDIKIKENTCKIAFGVL